MKVLSQFIVLFLVAVQPLAQGVESDEFLLNAYFKDQAVKSLETFLPKGDFLVQTSVKLKKIEKDETVTLPFGGSVVHLSDLQDSKNLPLSDLMKRIQSIKIQVSLDKAVPESMKMAIDSSLSSFFFLDRVRGDKVEFQLLPEGSKEVWHPAAKPDAAKEKPDYTLAYTLGGFSSLFLLIFFICFQRLQGSLSSAVRDSSQKRGDDEMPKMEMPRLDSAAGALSGSSKEVATLGSSNSISSMDLSLLKAFAIDSAFVERYQSVSHELLNGILPFELSNQLEESLPAFFRQEFVSAATLGEAYIKQILFKNLSDYRSFSKSPLLATLIQLDPASMVRGFLELETLERLVVLQKVGPLFRERLMEVLTPNDRLNLYSEVGTSLSELAFERNLKLIQIKLAKHFNPALVTVQSAFAKLGRNMLQPFTYAEDEEFFTQTRGRDEIAYLSVLEAFEIFGKADWANLDLYMVALAFAGYSDSVRAQLELGFEGKRKEWLKSIFTRLFTHSKPAFASPECSESRAKLMKIIAERKGNNVSKMMEAA